MERIGVYKMRLPDISHRKGLIFFFCIDGQYAGFNFKINKKGLWVTDAYLCFKIKFQSEQLYNRYITVATIAESNDIEINSEFIK